jgi:hypothetical protein
MPKRCLIDESFRPNDYYRGFMTWETRARLRNGLVKVSMVKSLLLY